MKSGILHDIVLVDIPARMGMFCLLGLASRHLVSHRYFGKEKFWVSR